MKIFDATIPSQFVRQDTRTNSDDQFANANEQQRRRLNHNILLAKRVRKCLLTRVCSYRDDIGLGGSGFFQTERFTTPAKISAAEIWLNVPLQFSPGTRELVFVLRAKRISTGNVTMYCRVEADNEKLPVDTNVSVTVNNTSLTRFAVTVPISREARQKGSGRLIVTPQGFRETAVSSGLTIVEIGPDFVDVAGSGTFSPGYIAAFSDTNVEPRRVVHALANIDAAGNQRVFVARPWNLLPVLTATVSSYTTASIAVDSYSVYEERVSAFFNEASNFQV